MTAVQVWTNRLVPLRWYHRLVGDGARTACGAAAGLYGHVVPVGTALALCDRPCPACFDPASGAAGR